jgi:hypothetical protein
MAGLYSCAGAQNAATLAAHDVSLYVIRAIGRPVDARFVVLGVAFVCIVYAELPRALIAPSIALDGKQTPFDYSLVVRAAIIVACVAIGIGAAIKYDAERQIDRLRPPPFWPKSAGGWLGVLVLFGLLLNALLKLVFLRD